MGDRLTATDGRLLGNRNPFQVYLLAFALLSSLPATLGFTTPPATVVSAIGPQPARVWVTLLVFGSTTALVGMVWPRRVALVPVNGLLLEQVGLVIVGCATVFYTLVAITAGGWATLPPLVTLLGFGAASFVQAWRIQKVIRSSQPQE